jgi:hypothetical protein
LLICCRGGAYSKDNVRARTTDRENFARGRRLRDRLLKRGGGSERHADRRVRPGYGIDGRALLNEAEWRGPDEGARLHVASQSPSAAEPPKIASSTESRRRLASNICASMSLLPAALAMLLVTGCDASSIVQAGPSREVTFRLGSQRLSIPSGCIAMPIDWKKENQGVIQEDALLLAMLLPDFECRAPANARKFNETGEAKPSVYFLIRAANHSLGVDVILRRAYRFETEGHPDYVAGSARWGHSGNLTLKRRIYLANGPHNVDIDVVGSPEDGSFVACTRPIAAGGVGGSSSVPMCEQYFGYGELYVKAGYGRAWVDRNKVIRERFIKELSSYAGVKSARP